ncbi:transmembrane protein, putative [Medicago truncatula]|uniref:Transmembrane protein, putative n=1 Tax=Medicago truncatula TaxID=3880 RepID=A0A072VCM7_MEDTR|nr:transmembrane protein, putative [Medicago truncatula]
MDILIRATLKSTNRMERNLTTVEKYYSIDGQRVYMFVLTANTGVLVSVISIMKCLHSMSHCSSIDSRTCDKGEQLVLWSTSAIVVICHWGSCWLNVPEWKRN